MSALVVGLSTGCFSRISIVDCLPAIRRAGFGLIEVSSAPTHLNYRDLKAVQRARRRMDELGIEPYSFHAPFSDAIDITALDETKRRAAIAELFYAAEAAAVLGVRCMVVHPGPERSGFPEVDRPIRLRHAVAALRGLAETCHRCKMTLVLENMLPHLFLGGIDDLVKICESLAGKDVGACLDTGHAFLGGDLLMATRRIGRYLRMIHAHDNRGRYDDHLPPGEGKIGWQAWWRELTAIHFRGTLILEIAGYANVDTTLARAKKGARYLSRLTGAPPQTKGPTDARH